FGFQQFLDALQGVLQYLRNVQGVGFLGQKLPVINRSIDDLLALADGFAGQLETFKNNPGQSLQGVKQLIKDAFGAEPAGIELSLDGHTVRIDLSFGTTLKKLLPFDIDLASLGLSNLSGLIGVDASGKLLLELGAQFDLHFG